MLDEVDLVTGVSGGSFTALAFGLYGDKLFDIYETSFLKRDVQGELIARALNPGNWGALSSDNWGRSELAAQFYDEILFHGATYADLDRGTGPLILASATDISTGARLAFTAIRLRLPLLGPERGAALPRCGGIVGRAVRTLAGDAQQLWRQLQVRGAEWIEAFRQSRDRAAACRPRPQDTRRTCRHSRMASTGRTSISWTAAWPTTSACAPCSRCWRLLEALNILGQPTPLDHVRRIIVFVVNSRSSPQTNWDEVERAPGNVALLIKATGVPIDHYSYEAVEQLKDTMARWQSMRRIRDSATLPGNHDPELAAAREGAGHRTSMSSMCPSPRSRTRQKFEYLNNCRHRSSCHPRRSIACAPRRGRSSFRRPSFSGC